MFDYEMQLVNALDNSKSVFVKKARGLGITEILLRYMAWLCVKDNTYNNCRFHIVTGPRINLAEELIDRIHGLFMNKLGIDCKTVGPIIYVNNVTIQAEDLIDIGPCCYCYYYTSCSVFSLALIANTNNDGYRAGVAAAARDIDLFNNNQISGISVTILYN